MIVRSVVPSPRGVGRPRRPACCPGTCAASVKALSPRLRSEGRDVDEAGDLAGVGVDVRDHHAAVGVADEEHRALDDADDVADGGGVGGDAAQRVGGRDDAWPASCSGSTTPSQLADSAKAPWTSTIVGRMQGFPSVEMDARIAKTGRQVDL